MKLRCALNLSSAAACAVALMLASAASAQANLIVNGSFETGDTTGWNESSGDISVGAPGIGPQEGVFALELNTPFDGVTDVNQGAFSGILPQIPADPGDEFILSGYMMTESLLPAVGIGATFGLFKIVFQDALGNSLVPASASIGIINTSAPGIESQPFLNGDSTVNTWIFSEARGVAPAGTVSVQFLALNVDFGNGGNHPMWYDNIIATSIAAPVLPVTVLNTNDSGAGSLRQAIAEAVTGATVSFTNTLSGQTILLTSGQILIPKNLDIDASGLAAGIIVDGNANGRIFEFLSGTTNILESLTLTNGFTPGAGGAVYINSGADITLNNSTLSGNIASEGAGIFNDTGTLTLNNSTLSGNGGEDGVGIYNNSGYLTLNNSTLSGNSGDLDVNGDGFFGGDGGGIYNQGFLTLHNSIVAGNTAVGAPNIFGSFAGANNLTSGNPLLAPLGDYGGPTRTMPPLPGSPAINAGLNTAATGPTDQRGFPRIVGSKVDIGAVELQPIVVLNTNDSGAGSLRQAISDFFSGAVITFTNTLDGQTILLTSGQILINGNLEIFAADLATGIIIDGNASGRIFEIAGSSTLIFDSLTLTNGFASGPSPQDRGGAIYISNTADLTLNTTTLSGNSAFSGGGIRMNGGTLTLNNSTLSGNSADFGGGIRIFSGQLTLNNSTLADNSATTEGGGGIRSNGGILTLNSSTLSGNTAATGGGGIHTFSGQLTVNNSTLSGNSAAAEGGGIFTDSGGLTLNSSTLSGNSASDFGGIRTIGGTPGGNNSIVAGNSASFGEPNITGIIGSNNLVSGDPVLAPLGDYGGPTETMPPLAGSPAIDAGIDTGSLAATDQRGVARVLSGGVGVPTVDIGAVEWNGWLLGEDLSGIDPDFLLPDSIYDGATVFPGGFDPAAAGMLEILSQAGKDELIAQGESNVTDNPATYGLFTESAFQALALDRPFLSYDSVSNKFTLTIGILQAPDLFTTFSNLTGFTTIPYPADGEIDIEFEPPNSDARFFEVYGSEPPSP